MKSFFIISAIYLTVALAAPPITFLRNGSFSDFHTSVLDDFEANLKRMREEFQILEKSLESGFKFPEDGIFKSGTNIFTFDPSKVKNESFSDTKIVDDKVVHTEEKVIANGNSVVHFKKVEITPKADKPKKKFDYPTTPEFDSSTTTNREASEFDDEKKSTVDENVIHTKKETSSTPKDVEEIEIVVPLELKTSPIVVRKAEYPNFFNELDGNYLPDYSPSEDSSMVVDLRDDTKVNDYLLQNKGKVPSDMIQLEPDAEVFNPNINKINSNTAAPKQNIDRGDPNSYYGYDTRT